MAETINKSKTILNALWPDKCWHEFEVGIRCDNCHNLFSMVKLNPDYFAQTPQGAYDREKMWARAMEMEWWPEFLDYLVQFSYPAPPSYVNGPEPLYEFLKGRA